MKKAYGTLGHKEKKKKLHYGNPEEKGTESIPKTIMDPKAIMGENFLNLGREMDI